MSMQSLVERISRTNPSNYRVNPCLGRTLRFDPDVEQVIGDDETNKLLRDGDRMCRSPCTMPEEVQFWMVAATKDVVDLKVVCSNGE